MKVFIKKELKALRLLWAVEDIACHDLLTLRWFGFELIHITTIDFHKRDAVESTRKIFQIDIDLAYFKHV